MRESGSLLRSLGVFLTGFAFGVATLTTFRHEIALSSRTATLAVLLLAGVALVGTVSIWLSTLQVRSRGQDAVSRWVQFAWGSLGLLMIYLTLVVVFLGF